jgi:hypothetical protein
LGKKDKQTCCLEPVDWFHDHNESTPHRPHDHKAFCYLEGTARVGSHTATLELRLDLRAKTVRRLNRHRSPERRLAFRSKNHWMRRQREEHAQAWLTAALQEALAGGAIEPGLQRFLRQPA